MVPISRILSLLVLALLPFRLPAQTSLSPLPAGPYLGQPLPGDQPVVFASGLISDTGERLHGPATFSPDGRVVCWSVIPPAIRYCFQREDGSWSGPLTIPIKARRVTAAQFAPDGRLWFQGVPVSGGAGSVDLGFVTWEGQSWSEARWPGPAVNTEGMDATPSCTITGDIFLTGSRPGKVWNRGIHRIPFREGYFQSREYLPPPINHGDGCIDYTVWVSPEGDFILWSSSRPTDQESDLKLYVSHRNQAGEWGDPVNLNQQLGLEAGAKFPSVSPDGRYLFFLMAGKIWWVEAAVIDGHEK